MSKSQIKDTEELLQMAVTSHAAIADVIAGLPPQGSAEALETCLDYVEKIGIGADKAGFADLTTIAEDLHTHFGVETGVLTSDCGEKLLNWLGDVLTHIESPDEANITEFLLRPLPKEIRAEMRTALCIPEVEQEGDEVEVVKQAMDTTDLESETPHEMIAVDEAGLNERLDSNDVDISAFVESDVESELPLETGGDAATVEADPEQQKADDMLVVDSEISENELSDADETALWGNPDTDEIDMSMFDDDESMDDGTDSMLGILASELLSISPELKALAKSITSSEDAGELIGAVGSYQELVYRFSSASKSLGLQGLVMVCDFVGMNSLLVAELSLAERANCLEVLQGWPPVVIDHLEQPGDDAFCLALVDYLEKESWPESLPYQEVRDLLEGLTKQLEMSGDYEVEARETQATPEDVALEMSEDASPSVIEAFFSESTGHAEKLSSLVEAIVNGEEIQENVEAAQRIAHTLKGSGNLVGVRGVASLSHHIEDIFEYIAKQKMAPPAALASTMQEAADTIEIMIEFLQGVASPPEAAQRVLQDVLNWANRVDSGSIRASDFSEDEKIPAMLLGDGTLEISEQQSEGFADKARAADTSNRRATDSLDRRATDSLDRRATDSPLRGATDSANNDSDAPNLPAQRAETIRVPAEILDNIFRIVGETAIATGQIQEHLKRLDNANQSVRKIDVSLQQRRYELENLVGVRGMAARHRSAAVAGGDSGFDPLEMDEYDEFYGVTHSYIEGVADSREILRRFTAEVSDLNALFLLQQRLNKELQHLVMTTRMVPVSTISARLQRAVRQACRATDKQSELIIIGEDLLLDGDVLNKLADPLMHMLRNSVDHGIEASNDRIDKGKSEIGNISLSFLQEGNNVVVSCVDDGAGLNYERIRETAVKNGLINSQESIDNTSLARMILQSGFSTSDSVTQISGRGVGMDVVHNAIQLLNGTMDITDAVGGGTQISLRMPITMLTSHCLLAGVGDDMVYAIPTSTLAQILSPGTGKIGNVGGNMTFQLGQDVYPARSLNSLIGFSDGDENVVKNSTVLLLQSAEGLTAITVDRVVNSHDLVVKNMGDFVKEVRGVVGVSTLGDGSVVAVLDLATLLKSADSTGVGNMANNSGVDTEGKEPELLKVLVVDDSLSVRSSLSQLMSDGGYQAVTARDGVEAVNMLEKEQPDLVLTDLEMPRMNGLELTSYIRESEQWKLLPVVMITSRTMAKHRQQAEAVGVNHYITKPFTEDDVLVSIGEQLNQV